MINSKPNNKNYHQGNYTPVNKDKILKLNSEDGVYYRSGLELKFMTWLDRSDKIKRWGSECLKIPYQLTHYEKNGDINLKSHIYYPDYYYEIDNNGIFKKVVVEVKPMKEYEDVILLEKKMFKIPKDVTIKKLNSLEYRLKMAQKNLRKWESMIKFCDLKGFDFIVITENHFKS